MALPKNIFTLFAIGFIAANMAMPVAAQTSPVILTEEEIVLVVQASMPYTYRIWKEHTPPRLVVDIADNPTAPAAANIPEELSFTDPLVKKLRHAQNAQGGTRLVFDLAYVIPNWCDEGWLEESDDCYQLIIKVPRLFVQQQTYPVGTNIRLALQHRGEAYGPVSVNVLETNVRRSPVRLELALAHNSILGLESVRAIAERNGALAAVNATYFHVDGQPLGLMVSAGLPISLSIYDRSAYLILKDGSYGIARASSRVALLLPEGSSIPVHGLNRPRQPGEIVVYNQAFGSTTPKNHAVRELVISNGQVVAVGNGGTQLTADVVVVATDTEHDLQNLPLGSRLQFKWSVYLPDEKIEIPGEHIWFALGAGPRLVLAGKVLITSEEERFRADITSGRAPRTALGITGEGHLLLVVVNGRQQGVSEGMTLQKLAELMIELGAVEAMNLDGGGSTTMVVRDRVVNKPSAGERPVASAILLYETNEME
jgi:exopolysaccharide biosynthesis protein